MKCLCEGKTPNCMSQHNEGFVGPSIITVWVVLPAVVVNNLSVV